MSGGCCRHMMINGIKWKTRAPSGDAILEGAAIGRPFTMKGDTSSTANAVGTKTRGGVMLTVPAFLALGALSPRNGEDTSSTANAVPLLPLEKALDNIRFRYAIRLLRERHFH